MITSTCKQQQKRKKKKRREKMLRERKQKPKEKKTDPDNGKNFTDVHQIQNKNQTCNKVRHNTHGKLLSVKPSPGPKDEN